MSWAIRTMEEWRLGALRENDGLWDDLFAESWDRNLKIYGATFTVEKMSQYLLSTPGTGDHVNGMVTTLHVEFGPHTIDRISQIISFKVFDSHATQAITGPYAALSHMWGRLIPLCIIKSNYEELKDEILM
ncbi:hypothetical protein LZ554_004213 [Drepanopeziza brunnea f. sp. 'monogermtubi']|nr:hypothetical protein LZ554_004213 [Drepanopeziza brunnea f. sp. 'monogermtubi']